MVAQVNEQKAADDPETEEGGPRLLQRSAVTRLRPYTSLYIPHGPRDIERRPGGQPPLDRRSHSLPHAGDDMFWGRHFARVTLVSRAGPCILHD